MRQARTAARFTTVIAAALAGLALLLAGIGIYGILAYTVAQRSAEIGVRVALGGRPSDIAWLVLRQTVGLVGAGLLAGLVGSLLMTRLLQKLLYGVGPRDLGTLAAAAAVLAAVGLVAALVPARRAVRVDPIARAARRVSRPGGSRVSCGRLPPQDFSPRDSFLSTTTARPSASRARR